MIHLAYSMTFARMTSSAPRNIKIGSWNSRRSPQKIKVSTIIIPSAMVKKAFAFSGFPSPRAAESSTEPPMPQRMDRKTINPKRGQMTAIAAAPSSPSDCPTAMVSTKL